jgi:release factor glutamine methyltransferase
MSNVSIWIKKNTDFLSINGIESARLDCLVLLEDELNKDRAWILANPEFEIPHDSINNLDAKILRRAKHEPLAYIRGKTEFYGREFFVNKYTLEPRPETETMIDMLKNLPNSFQAIVDVGTGSGAIAITLKLLYPDKRVYAIDIDNKCIQVAKQNAKLHNVNIIFSQGNLIAPIMNEVPKLGRWAILANLPYVPENHQINQAAMFEPLHAIFGGEDGLDYYREMFNQIDHTDSKPSYVLAESLPFQHKNLEQIALKSSYKLSKTDDFIQAFTNSQ